MKHFTLDTPMPYVGRGGLKMENFIKESKWLVQWFGHFGPWEPPPVDLPTVFCRWEPSHQPV